MKKLISILKQFGRWLKYWLWEIPTAQPPKEKPVRLKATEVQKEYMVVTYHGQRINMRVAEYPLWKRMSRTDKRAMAAKYRKLEQEHKVRFEMVDGKLIGIKNRDYGVQKDVK